MGDSSDKGNYRPIALVTACPKIFKICLLKMLKIYLETDDHQFGFKSQHATDMCIFTVKNVIKYYTKLNSSVFTCVLDAAKAFDRVNHWTLVSKLIQRNIPLVIVKIIAFWYQTQPICIKRGKFNSMYFKVSNAVRQGGVLSPKHIYSMCSLTVSTLDSPAVEPRSNPGSSKILIGENLRLYTTSPVGMC